MDRKKEILKRLTETEGYVSGQELCRMLQVSRTAVWKIIKKLKEEGYPIEAVTNKGYRLLSMEETDIFNREQIVGKLSTSWAGRPLIFKEETGSTNDDVFALAAEGYPHGTLVVAARQTAGKGRRGRTWISPEDGNIYMSILLKPDLRPEITPMLTVVMALSVYQAAQKLLSGQPSSQQPSGSTGTENVPADESEHESPVESSLESSLESPLESPAAENDSSADVPACRFGIKWPNDIVASVNGGPYRKLCGILTEMRMEDSEISAITIGIGLNVNQTEFSSEIAENAGSFSLSMGRKINRAALTASIWNFFEQNYLLFVQKQDFSALRPAYEAGLVNCGKSGHVLDPKNPFTGTAIGINDEGELLVQPDDGGPVRVIGSGEVSVRGVKGYV